MQNNLSKQLANRRLCKPINLCNGVAMCFLGGRNTVFKYNGGTLLL